MKIIAAIAVVLARRASSAPTRKTLRRDIGLDDRPVPRRDWQDYW